MDEKDDIIEGLQETNENQRAVLALALETLEGLGFDMEDFVGATLD